MDGAAGTGCWAGGVAEGALGSGFKLPDAAQGSRAGTAGGGAVGLGATRRSPPCPAPRGGNGAGEGAERVAEPDAGAGAPLPKPAAADGHADAGPPCRDLGPDGPARFAAEVGRRAARIPQVFFLGER